jgi:hypothetical protein
MKHAAVFLGLFLLAGCGTSEPQMPKQYYQAAAKTPGPPLAKVISVPPDAAAAQVLAGLGDTALTPGHVDLAQGIVVATYSGNPEEFVDCGKIRFGRRGPSVPASRQSFTVNSLVGDEYVDGTIGRDLRLDSRLVIAAQPFGTSTSVSVHATHVLTKKVAYDDEIVGTESIAFDNQSEGSFQKGTDCHSTGKLEQMALAGVPGPLVILGGPPTQQFASTRPAPMAAAAPTATISQTELAPPGASSPTQPLQQAALPPVPPLPPGAAIEGVPGQAPAAARTASQQALLDCAQLTGSAADQMCEVLMLLAPYRSGAVGARLVQGNQPLRQGDDLVLELDLPAEPVTLQLSHIDGAGVVTHLPDLPVRGDVRRSIFATGLQVTQPLGQEVVLVMAARDQPVTGPRPRREPIASYAAALRQGLSRPAARLDADAVLVATTGQ